MSKRKGLSTGKFDPKPAKWGPEFLVSEQTLEDWAEARRLVEDEP